MKTATLFVTFALTLLAASELAGGAVAQCELQSTASSTASSGDRFGGTIAIDGTTALVTASGDDSRGTNAGAVFVMQRTGSQWIETGSFTAAETGPSDRFGSSLSLEGDLLFVGAPTAPVGGSDAGAVYLFDRQGTTWVEGQKLVANDPDDDDWFGVSIALSGSTLLIGANRDDAGGNEAGAAYVFERQGSTWVQTDKLLSPLPESGARFGQAVDLDGDNAVIGAPHKSSPTGRAFVFERQGTNWSPTELQPLPGFGSMVRFGSVVHVTGDDVVVGFTAGAARLFQPRAGGWPQIQHFPGSTPSSIVREGNQILMGKGLYLLRGDTWVSAGHCVVSNLNYSIPTQGGAILPDQILAGVQPNLGMGSFTGRLFVYDYENMGLYCTAKTNSQGCVPRIEVFGFGPFVSHFIGAQNVLNQKRGVLLHGMERDNHPLFGGILCVAQPLTRGAVVFSEGSAPPTSDCSGSFYSNFLETLNGGGLPWAVPGVVVRSQFWYRDPLHSDGTGIGLTDACEFEICQ